VLRISNGHLHEVVVVSGHKVRLDHLRDLRQGIPELPKHVLVMPFEGHLDEDDVRDAHDSMVEDRDIALDGATVFKALHSCPAWGLGKADFLGELRHREPTIAPQSREDFAVKLIERWSIEAAAAFRMFVLPHS